MHKYYNVDFFSPETPCQQHLTTDVLWIAIYRLLFGNSINPEKKTNLLWDTRIVFVMPKPSCLQDGANKHIVEIGDKFVDVQFNYWTY